VLVFRYRLGTLRVLAVSAVAGMLLAVAGVT